MGKNRKTLEISWWLQLSKRQKLSILPVVRFAMRRLAFIASALIPSVALEARSSISVKACLCECGDSRRFFREIGFRQIVAPPAQILRVITADSSGLRRAL